MSERKVFHKLDLRITDEMRKKLLSLADTSCWRVAGLYATWIVNSQKSAPNREPVVADGFKSRLRVTIGEKGMARFKKWSAKYNVSLASVVRAAISEHLNGNS